MEFHALESAMNVQIHNNNKWAEIQFRTNVHLNSAQLIHYASANKFHYLKADTQT